MQRSWLEARLSRASIPRPHHSGSVCGGGGGERLRVRLLGMVFSRAVSLAAVCVAVRRLSSSLVS